MQRKWKLCLAAVILVSAALGFIGGMLGADIENYYRTSWGCFPGHPYAHFKFLGYPGLFIATPTAVPAEDVDCVYTYDWVSVAMWNALIWPVGALLIMAIFGWKPIINRFVTYLVSCHANRRH